MVQGLVLLTSLGAIRPQSRLQTPTSSGDVPRLSSAGGGSGQLLTDAAQGLMSREM